MNHFLAPEAKKRLQKYLNGEQKRGFDCLYKRLGGRGEVLRMLHDDGSSTIVKVWHCKNLYEQIKNALRMSNGRREWDMHCQLYAHKVPVPVPLCFENLPVSHGGSCEVMVMEDLGETKPVGHYLNFLRLKKKDDVIASVEDELLDITENIVGLGFVDIDNHLRNFLVASTGRLVRIDFEVACRPLLQLVSKKKYAQMMARLIESHVYAMQPEADRTIIFAKKLYHRFHMDNNLKATISALVNQRLSKHSASENILCSIKLPV